MSEWKTVSLGDLAANEPGSIAIGPFGSRMKAENYISEGVPVIRGTNISSGKHWKGEWVFISDDFANTMQNCTVQEEDLVFPHRGSIGEVAIVDNAFPRYMLSTSLMKFRADLDKAIPLYLFYYFRSPLGRAEIMRFSSQVGTPGIGQPLSSLKQFKVPLPPSLDIQKTIASILSSLDDKIELNRRMNETLEAMARAIFKDWFVDFGPTRAKQEGRAAYLPEHLWSLFPEAIDFETGLPMGWELVRLGSIAESVNRTVNPTEIDEQTPYIGLEHMPRGSIALSDWEGAGKVTSNKLRFQTGEFLFGKLRPYFHKVGIAPLSGICSTDIVVVRAKSETWSSLVLTAISTDNFVEYTNLTSTGTKMPRTSWSIMAKYELPLPAEHLVKQFELMIKPCTSQIISNIHLNRTLAELRDRLLPKLMSGEIRVKDAEKLVEEVM